MGKIFGIPCQLFAWCTQMQVTQGTVGMWWSMAVMLHMARGSLSKQGGVLHGISCGPSAGAWISISKRANERVRMFTDNQNVARLLLVGSKTAKLQEEEHTIFLISIANWTQVEQEWIPCSRNQQADNVSRLVDHDDWQLDPEVFAELTPVYTGKSNAHQYAFKGVNKV